VDISAAQLATARAMQSQFQLFFPLIQADAEHVPLRDGCADLVISEFGASLWCDPYRWIPEASRLLRRGGLLIVVTLTALLAVCRPGHGPAQAQLARDLFGLQPRRWSEVNGVEYYLPHGQWIRLLRTHHLQVEDLMEIQAPADADNDFSDLVTHDWARRWPAEEAWFARRI
jgi:SAM-dependent methyltransferase